MAKTKRVDPIKQREKRAKIAAAIGGVVFLAVAAIEIPPLMKSSSPPPSASHSTTTTTTTPTTAPTTGTAAAAPAPAAGELADTDAPPPVEPGELVSFSMFQSKNPFTPQVTTPADGSTPSTPAPTTAQKQGAGVPATSTTPTTTTTPATATLPTTTVPAGTAGVVPSASATTAAPGPTVAISVNGGVSHVATDGTFPDASPVFRLVSYTKGTAEVGIVGGSYAAGGATLTLHLHTPVTLENQTDGKRYTLELDSTP